ncbi:hypothetical protein Tco_0318618 [Tanacetum coccineum]
MTSRPRTRIPSRPCLGVWTDGQSEDKSIELQIMAASAINYLFLDSSDEQLLWDHRPIGLFFCDIPTVIPSTFVVLHYFTIHMQSILSEYPDSSDGLPSQDPYVATVARWRADRGKHNTSISSYEFLLLCYCPTRDSSNVSAILIRPQPTPLLPRGLAIPFGELTATHYYRARNLRILRLVHSLGLEIDLGAFQESSNRDVFNLVVLPSEESTKTEFYSSEASIEEDAEVGTTGTGVDMELGIGDGDDVGDYVEIDLRDVRDDTKEYEADASAGDMAEVLSVIEDALRRLEDDLLTKTTLETFTGATMGLYIRMVRHLIIVDLMPLELGCFDVIIGMDWLAKNHAVIVCDEKFSGIPYEMKFWSFKRTKVYGDVKENKGPSSA